MKAFTIWQPWASLIMIGAKPFEFRSRSYLEYVNPPRPADRIVVHAGARPIRWKEVWELRNACEAGGRATGLKVDKATPLLERLTSVYKCRGVIPEGAGLGTAIIGKPRNAGEIFRKPVSPDVRGLYDTEEIAELDGRALPSDSDRGDFNWAWPLTDIEHFEPPVPMRGMQGFWTWPERMAA